MSAAVALRKLAGLTRVIDQIALVTRRAARYAAPALTKLLRAEFAAGSDPYGRAWRGLMASTKARGRRNPPLTDTRRLKNSTKAMPMFGGRAGVRLVVGQPYGVFHQFGFRVGRTRVKPRRILPQFGLPGSWRAAIERAALRATREAKRK